MLNTFAILLLFQCLGEALAFVLHLPLPGPVIGMLLLLAALAVSPRLMNIVEATGSELLRHLSLLFVPAGVGIMAAAGTIAGHWLAIILALFGSIHGHFGNAEQGVAAGGMLRIAGNAEAGADVDRLVFQR